MSAKVNVAPTSASVAVTAPLTMAASSATVKLAACATGASLTAATLTVTVAVAVEGAAVAVADGVGERNGSVVVGCRRETTLPPTSADRTVDVRLHAGDVGVVPLSMSVSLPNSVAGVMVSALSSVAATVLAFATGIVGTGDRDDQVGRRGGAGVVRHRKGTVMTVCWPTPSDW